MGYPQFTLPYQQPPQEIMAVGTNPMDNMGFYAVFAILAVALLVTSGIYAVHRIRGR